ncbi:hypothetical protein GYMLUDRAFT_437070 [Collybiopsis luxurians FD-317 M1]|uniref:Unplaced genomic scaffold GYMLUscaffold_14, whole genome shotgun sequence n=1 Tax=Collybiopsis luxurians FD-317 M1 TaxID=944289 RepID=A0A0D0CWJ8_9AGAR|nr:hypothetical protein GYMLUDRAFT_437070 [Collybiopsis luxurians FD-317 M1]
MVYRQYIWLIWFGWLVSLVWFRDCLLMRKIVVATNNPLGSRSPCTRDHQERTKKPHSPEVGCGIDMLGIISSTKFQVKCLTKRSWIE